MNEKIKDFFEICKAKELTGKLGIIIPDSNMKNLMLDESERVLNAISFGIIFLISHKRPTLARGMPKRKLAFVIWHLCGKTGFTFDLIG